MGKENQNKTTKEQKLHFVFFNSKVFKMLTFEQKMLMSQMIFNEKEILFGEFGPGLSKVEKQEKWMEILVKLNSVGANLTDYKILRDNEWSNAKRATEKKLATLK